MFTETFVRVKRANSHRLFSQTRRFCKTRVAKTLCFINGFLQKATEYYFRTLRGPARNENRPSGVQKFSVNLRLQEQCADVAHVTEENPVEYGSKNARSSFSGVVE